MSLHYTGKLLYPKFRFLNLSDTFLNGLCINWFETIVLEHYKQEHFHTLNFISSNFFEILSLYSLHTIVATSGQVMLIIEDVTVTVRCGIAIKALLRHYNVIKIK